VSERPRVLVTHRVLDPAPALLAKATEVIGYQGELSSEPIAAAAAGCGGILSQSIDPIDERVLSTPGLRVVSNVAVGYNNIDVEAATRRGVLVTNTPGVLDETTADLAFALILAAARRLGEGERMIRAGGWDGWAIDQLLGRDIHGSTLGIVGLGRIGQAVARRGRGFGMRIIYAQRSPAGAEVERELGAERRELSDLLVEADFVSLHTPLTAETTRLIGAAELARMKPSAVLVNTARGPVVDEAALAQALRERRIFAAGLDVFEAEPKVHPDLLGMENVVLLPHLGSASVDTRSKMCETAASNLVAALGGERPEHLVNPQAWRES